MRSTGRKTGIKMVPPFTLGSGGPALFFAEREVGGDDHDERRGRSFLKIAGSFFPENSRTFPVIFIKTR